MATTTVNPTLDESVNRAVADEKAKLPEQKVEEKKEEPKVEEKKEEKKEPELDLRTKQALELYDALMDPDKAVGIVDFLSAQIKGTAKETGKTEKQVAKDIKTIILENTPEQYHFLAESLAKGIEAAINSKVQEGVAPVKEAFEKSIETQSIQQINNATDAFQKSHGIKDDKDLVWVEMGKISQELPWNGKTSMQNYLERIYQLATKGAAETKSIIDKNEKIRKNSEDLSSGKSSEVDEARITRGSKLPTLHEAVSAAFKGERLG